MVSENTALFPWPDAQSVWADVSRQIEIMACEKLDIPDDFDAPRVLQLDDADLDVQSIVAEKMNEATGRLPDSILQEFDSMQVQCAESIVDALSEDSREELVALAISRIQAEINE